MGFGDRRSDRHRRRAIVNAELHGTPSIDPLMFVASAGILLLAMLAAGFIPARRAAGVDPIVVLRRE